MPAISRQAISNVFRNVFADASLSMRESLQTKARSSRRRTEKIVRPTCTWALAGGAPAHRAGRWTSGTVGTSRWAGRPLAPTVPLVHPDAGGWPASRPTHDPRNLASADLERVQKDMCADASLSIAAPDLGGGRARASRGQ